MDNIPRLFVNCVLERLMLTVMDYKTVAPNLRGEHRNNHFCKGFLPQCSKLRLNKKLHDILK